MPSSPLNPPIDNIMQNETENQTRLRRAKESLNACRTAENEARRALAAAELATRQAKARHEQLFMAEENQEMERRRKAYEHCTA